MAGSPTSLIIASGNNTVTITNDGLFDQLGTGTPVGSFFVEFIPQKNITAFELATILPYLFGRPIYKDEWETLDNNIKRHLNKG